jgi:hypothetical protein
MFEHIDVYVSAKTYAAGSVDTVMFTIPTGCTAVGAYITYSNQPSNAVWISCSLSYERYVVIKNNYTSSLSMDATIRILYLKKSWV